MYSTSKDEKCKKSKEGAIKLARKLKICFNWNYFETCSSTCSVSDQGVLCPVPSGEGDLTGRRTSGTLLPWRWKSDVWRFMSRHYFVSVPSTINTCLTLRFTHSLAPAVNAHCYPGTIGIKPRTKKIYYTCWRIMKCLQSFLNENEWELTKVRCNNL